MGRERPSCLQLRGEQTCSGAGIAQPQWEGTESQVVEGFEGKLKLIDLHIEALGGCLRFEDW